MIFNRDETIHEEQIRYFLVLNAIKPDISYYYQLLHSPPYLMFEGVLDITLNNSIASTPLPCKHPPVQCQQYKN